MKSWEKCGHVVPTVFSGQTSPHFSLFLGKIDIGFYLPKLKKTIQTVINEKCKNQPLMVWRCISARNMGDLHICEGTLFVEAYIGILERYMLPSRRLDFPGTPCLFQQDNSRPHSA